MDDHGNANDQSNANSAPRTNHDMALATVALDVFQSLDVLRNLAALQSPWEKYQVSS